MRLISFLIFIGTLTVSANSYSQQVKLDLSIENSSVEYILLSIEENSRFIFIYDAKIIKSLDEKSINVNGQSIGAVLDKLFEDTDIFYRIDGRQVFLYQKDKAYQPDYPKTDIINLDQVLIQGKVTDKKGLPLPGVTIVVKGTTIGVITDTEGNYEIEVPQDAKVLVFSFVGMKTKEIEIEGQTNIKVLLEEDAIGIEEVVAVGYGIQKRVTITGSVAAIKGAEMIQTKTANLAESLAGRVPGLVINSRGGEPGSDEQI